jgi:predicted HTH transcriptional regulator
VGCSRKPESGPIKIENYPEKFIFTNPGDMRHPLTLAKEGGISDCRNRIIQRMFSHIGYGDQEGFGIVTIYTKWGQNSGNSPVYNLSVNPVMTTLTLKRNPDLVKDTIESLEVKPTTLMSEAESLGVKPDIHMSEPSQRDLLLNKLSDETKSKINITGKRTKPDGMKLIIREICSQGDFTIDDLCIILEKKSRSTFYSKYITELVSERKIQKTNPEKPTSPKQKYRTILSQSEVL